MQSHHADFTHDYIDLISQEAELIKSMITPDNLRLVTSGETYSVKKDEIIIVLEGLFSIELLQVPFSEHPCDEGESIKPYRVGHGIRGMMFGLMETYGPPILLQYVAKSNVKLASFSRDYFERVFIRHDKFSFLMKVMSFMLAMVLDSYRERNFGNRYHVIRAMLYRYQKQHDRGFLYDSSLASFIMKRTKISRSYLFHILSALKSGGYIEVKGGKSLSIIKELPYNF